MPSPQLSVVPINVRNMCAKPCTSVAIYITHPYFHQWLIMYNLSCHIICCMIQFTLALNIFLMFSWLINGYCWVSADWDKVARISFIWIWWDNQVIYFVSKAIVLLIIYEILFEQFIIWSYGPRKCKGHVNEIYICHHHVNFMLHVAGFLWKMLHPINFVTFPPHNIVLFPRYRPAHTTPFLRSYTHYPCSHLWQIIEHVATVGWHHKYILWISVTVINEALATLS